MQYTIFKEIDQAMAHMNLDGSLKLMLEKIIQYTESQCAFLLSLQEKTESMIPFIKIQNEKITNELELSSEFLKECFNLFIKSKESFSTTQFETTETIISETKYSMLGCPLLLAGKPVALFLLARDIDKLAITDDQSSFVASLMPRIASIYENLRLENEMIHKNSRLSALYDISQQTESVIDIRNVYGSLSKVAQSFIKFDAYQLYTISADGTTLEPKLLEPDHELMTGSIKVGEGPIGKAAETGEPQLSYMGEYNSVLILPITVSAKVTGVFAIGSRKQYAYRNEDIIGLRIIATHIASIDMMFKDLLTLKGFTERILDSMNSGVLIFDKVGRVSYANPEIKLMLHINLPDAWNPLTSEEKLPPELHDLIIQTLKTNVSQENKKLQIKLKDDSYINIEVNAFPFRSEKTDTLLGTAFFIKDITQIARMEEQLRRADKLSAIGMLAAGVAHEIRNPLTGMKMITQILEDDYEADDPKREPLGIIQKEINRLEGIVGNLLGFAKPSKFTITKVRIEDIINDCHTLIQNQLKKQHINYSITIEGESPVINGDPNQLKQVFINIMTNSVQAQPNGGILEVKIHNQDNWVITELKDSGYGIPQDKLKEIFNPFMTTKDDGTGLGLPMAQRIVEEHEGRIEVRSELGKGAVFSVWLPALK